MQALTRPGLQRQAIPASEPAGHSEQPLVPDLLASTPQEAQEPVFAQADAELLTPADGLQKPASEGTGQELPSSLLDDGQSVGAEQNGTSTPASPLQPPELAAGAAGMASEEIAAEILPSAVSRAPEIELQASVERDPVPWVDRPVRESQSKDALEKQLGSPAYMPASMPNSRAALPPASNPGFLSHEIPGLSGQQMLIEQQKVALKANNITLDKDNAYLAPHLPANFGSFPQLALGQAMSSGGKPSDTAGNGIAKGVGSGGVLGEGVLSQIRGTTIESPVVDSQFTFTASAPESKGKGLSFCQISITHLQL